MNLWANALADNPLIAILRGLTPDRAIAVADVLVDSGFRIIEVPLNSPDALSSITKISEKHGEDIVVGAGTVVSVADVDVVLQAGGRVIVAPNLDPEVGARAIAHGAKWCPGVMTPTEAFAALKHGASILKIFPAELVPPQGIAAMRAVLPKAAAVAVVGGITPNTMAEYLNVGANGFGLGSALFKPSYELPELRRRAETFVQTYRGLT